MRTLLNSNFRMGLSLALIFSLACGDDDGGGDASVDAATDSSAVDSSSADASGEDADTPDASEEDADTPDSDGFGPAPGTIGGDRPARVRAPGSYDGSEPFPLLISLHGFGGTGSLHDGYFGLGAIALERNMILVTPDGTTNSGGQQFWNATPQCCDMQNSGVDDVAYLTGLIEEAKATMNIDPRRIYFIGHSNGGFMSYRMACELGGEIAAIASLAGATFLDESMCEMQVPVSILQVHGSNDDLVPFTAGQQSVERHATYAGCDETREEVGMLDFERALPGDETVMSTHTGCNEGIDLAFWNIQNGGHIPAFSAGGVPAMVDWLLDHQAPE